MKTYKITVDFYAGNKKVYDKTFPITEENEEKARLFVLNWLSMEEYSNVKITGVKVVTE